MGKKQAGLVVIDQLSADAYSSGYAPEENYRLQDKQWRYRLSRCMVWLVENRSG